MEECTKKAIEFLDDVMGRLGEDKYDEFEMFLMDYDAKRIEITDFIENVKEIFEGDTYLLLKFNIFIPTEYEIKLPLEGERSQPKKHVTMEDATRFLNKIKAQLERVDNPTYKSFMSILTMYHNKQKSFTMVCQEVITLLQGHPELLNEFYEFLPKAVSDHYIGARNCARGDK
ncbi:paired amphipathic helix protein Sin3-like 4 [Lathyrus oleraceus]|nr:paired amphipathic helix protein Sin3-like 4 [Pisum sativum]